MSTECGQPLDIAQADRFRQAMALLQTGAHAAALSIAEALARQAPAAADAWQLLGMCLDGSGQTEQAQSAFEHALALAPGSAVLSRNFGLFLARHGKALRERDELEAAEPVLARAVSLAPGLAFAWADLGAVRRLLGQVDGALMALRKAADLQRQRGADPVELEDAISGSLADAGRPADALAAARALVARHPGHPSAHETLGHLLWEHGPDLAPGEDPLAAMQAAASAQPHNRALQLALARMLLTVRRAGDALPLLQRMRKREPGDPLLDWFAADALDALARHGEAGTLYASVARGRLGGHPEFLNAYARHAFRTGRIELAVECAQRVVAVAPRNQEGWSHLGTAWRMLGDGREGWLCDYECLVGMVEVEPPPGFSDLASFLQTLAPALEALHLSGREPMRQSVRGGTQTTGLLFGRNEPIVQAVADALRRAAERWLATLPADRTHPFLAHRQRSVRFVGSWSVRLRSAGRHVNHIHPKGWMSSAFYVALPESVRQPRSASRAGWIQFGQPLEELGLDLPPRRVVQPRAGHLALFPSYMWHGTVPFEDLQPRLTIAFDMQPKP